MLMKSILIKNILINNKNMKTKKKLFYINDIQL